MGCFEFTHRWPQIGPDLLSGDDTLTASAWSRLEDRDREIEDRVGCSDGSTDQVPTGRVKPFGFNAPTLPTADTFDELVNGAWNIVKMAEAFHEYDGMTLVSDSGLLVPSSGIYSASAQVFLEHWGAIALADVTTGAQYSSGSHAANEVEWQTEVDVVGGNFAYAYNGTPELNGASCDFTGIIDVAATVTYQVNAEGVTPDHSLTATLAIKIGGATVVTDTAVVPTTGEGSVTAGGTGLAVAGTIASPSDVTVELAIDGTWGTNGVYMQVQTTDFDSSLTVTRHEAVRRVADPRADALIALVVQSTDNSAQPGMVTVGCDTIDHIGQVSNTAFGCVEDDIIQCWVYPDIDETYGLEDIRVVKTPIATSGWGVDVIAVGEGSSENLGRQTELSAHWVRDATVSHNFSTPA